MFIHDDARPEKILAEAVPALRQIAYPVRTLDRAFSADQFAELKAADDQVQNGIQFEDAAWLYDAVKEAPH